MLIFRVYEKKDFRNVSATMQDYEASGSVRALSDYLCRYYGQKVIILLDEYDTTSSCVKPKQSAYFAEVVVTTSGLLKSEKIDGSCRGLIRFFLSACFLLDGNLLGENEKKDFRVLSI